MINIIIKLSILFLICFNTMTTSEELAKSNKKQLINFFAGGLAGTVSSTLTTPLEVIKTQLQSSRIDKFSNPFKVATEILKQEGPRGFFKGISFSITFFTFILFQLNI